jgi:hypothetical protein
VAATRAASSAANSAPVRRQICTRGMEPGLSAATLQIRRDRHQASSPRILAQSWNHENARNRSVGVSSLKPPLLGNFLSRFAQSRFGCSIQSIALANTSSYWAISARWERSRDGAAALPTTQHKVLEPETSPALYHSRQALWLSLTALGCRCAFWRALPRHRGSCLSHQMPQAATYRRNHDKDSNLLLFPLELHTSTLPSTTMPERMCRYATGPNCRMGSWTKFWTRPFFKFHSHLS